METILVIIIVSVVVLWACRASYRMFTGKTGCSCSVGGCNKNDGADLPQKRDG